MMKGVRLFIWLVCITGIFYPLTITAIAWLTMETKSTGSIIKDRNHQPIASLLIGQKFEREEYFWSRPSASDYNTLPSMGSNLAPTSQILVNQVKERRERFLSKRVPSDLLFASASGIDPHISVEAALFQVERVAKARKMDKHILERLVEETIEGREWGFLGIPRVNVVLLNRKLDSVGT